MAGVTIRCAHSRRGNDQVNADSTARPGHHSRGRPTWRRNTATSCRNTSSSAVMAASLRPSSVSQPNIRTEVRYSIRTTMNDIIGAAAKTPPRSPSDRRQDPGLPMA